MGPNLILKSISISLTHAEIFRIAFLQNLLSLGQVAQVARRLATGWMARVRSRV